MSTTATTSAGRLEARVLREGYGPGAWHGADLKAALADVTPAMALWRPSTARHNIAEIALHHAYCARSVRGQLTGTPPEPFVLDGDDWFAVADERTLSWKRILEVVEQEQERLSAAVASGRAPAFDEAERFNLVLGITCHAIYHAGQVQLLKKLQEG
jgi:DinB family protein